MKKQKNKNIFTIIFFIIFLVFLIFAVSGRSFGIDNYVNESMVSLRNPSFTDVMMFFTMLGNYYSMIILFLVLFGLLFFLNKKKEALLLSACMASGWAVSELLKLSLGLARPENGLLLES